MRILFISRAYPPVLGGIERQNYELAHALAAITPTTIIANTRGKLFLPVFLPYVFLRLLATLPRHDAVLFGDGVLTPLGAIAKYLFPQKRFVSVIHGLDVTFAQKRSLLGRVYKAINIPSLRRMDRLVMVGNHTIDQAVAAGVDRARCIFIPNGLHPDNLAAPHTRDELARILDMDLTGKHVILRVGRFVPHKGTAWFLDHVMPHLPATTVFVAAGGRNAGSVGDRDAYTDAVDAVARHGLSDRVRLLTNIPQDTMRVLLNTADLYVAPNIDIPGSMEGFGINAIEAAACGRTVLAANLQGLLDAVHDGADGILVPHDDAAAWIDAVTHALDPSFDRTAFGAAAAAYTRAHFDWPPIAQRYLDVLRGDHVA